MADFGKEIEAYRAVLEPNTSAWKPVDIDGGCDDQVDIGGTIKQVDYCYNTFEDMSEAVYVEGVWTLKIFDDQVHGDDS